MIIPRKTTVATSHLCRLVDIASDCADVCPYNKGRVVGGVFYYRDDEDRVEHVLSSFGVRARFTLEITEHRSSLG